MTITFTDDEIIWINKDIFNWSIKDGCPQKIKESIEKKLKLINNFSKEVKSNARSK